MRKSRGRIKDYDQGREKKETSKKRKGSPTLILNRNEENYSCNLCGKY